MSQFVILCDHASNHVPPELRNLGLPSAELERHIAWDIGAAGIATELSRVLDAPMILSPASRLVIDCNRQLDARDLIPEISDATVIPGNRGLSEQQKAARIDGWFRAYHDHVEAVIAACDGPIVISVHTMTPVLAGSVRPWQISLSSFDDRSLVDPVLHALRAPGDITVGDNQPYDLDPAVDYSIPYHAIRRGLDYLQVEFRQDEVQTPAGQITWAQRFAHAIVESGLQSGAA